MSRAEERARYLGYMKDPLNRAEYTANDEWEAFIDGYHQAEKDLELTLEDIEKIHIFLYAVKNNKKGVLTFTSLSNKQYLEVLKRFKNLKK